MQDEVTENGIGLTTCDEDCVEHIECIGRRVNELHKMVVEIHSVMIFLGRKARDMEHTPLGKLLGKFGG